VRPCIACNQCLRRLFAPEPINCAVNPEAGREEAPAPGPAKAARRVVVLGGGAAGMSAALRARERGHEVTLLEAAPELGGRLLAAACLPHRHEMGELARYLARRVREAGVTVRLGSAATPALVRELAPDVLIRATGGRPAIPRVPGIDRPHVETAERCLLGLVPGAGPAVVVGDTAVAGEVALALHEAGYSPTLLCPVSRERLAWEAESVTRRALLADLGRRGIPTLCEAELVAVGAAAVQCRTAGGDLRQLPAGRVVLAFGGEPDAAGAAAWAEAAPVVLDAGDCLTPGGVLGAVHGAEALLEAH
jgi:NADPH-dependent 2,4-dienoyl-CoA reductase/sulfur reductase-like enzyme